LNGKKIIFIWMRGANDSLNSIIPIGDSQYALNRPTIGLQPDGGINYASTGACFDATQYADAALTARVAADPTYSYNKAITTGNGFAALHPSLKFLAPVYNAGDLALIHRVAYPKQSRSHFDSQNYWENGIPTIISRRRYFLSDHHRVRPREHLAAHGGFHPVRVPLILRGSARR